MSKDQQLASAKADFGSIYAAANLQPCYRTLAPLEYSIPGEAHPKFERAISAVTPRGDTGSGGKPA